MATIAENLQTLNETKTAIKTAIESKGQNLTDVPFTGYAEKITAISGGTVDKSAVIKEIIAIRNGQASNLLKTDAYASPLTDETIKNFIKYDTLENAKTLSGAFYYQTSITKYPKMNTRNVIDLEHCFYANISLVEPPDMITENSKNLYYTFNTCVKLAWLPLYDTKKVEYMGYCCNDCRELKSIAGWDMRNCYSYAGSFNLCYAIEEIWIKNIKANLQVGQGTNWGHLLTQESALSLCFQCRNTGATKTITFAAPVFDNLATLYVKLVPITDEMRADDDLIDEKYPFELCESTDSGAMTIATYMTNKMWAIARG